MATIVTRAGKGSPLTHNEVDANFNNLNNDKVEESTTITAGTGLTGGGDLSANRTISLANTAVAAGSYGSASAVGTFTVDAQGRLTAASNTNIAIANTAVSGLGTMSTQNANSVAITGGSINGTTVGASTASTGAFTTLSSTGNTYLATSSGSVGVGTNTASFKITNNFDAPATWGNDAANFIEMWQNSGTNALGVAMGDNSIASFTTNNGYNLVLATDGVERMRVATSTGNVGIGGAAGTKFQVFGNNETVRFTPASGTTSTTATFGTFRNSGNVFYFGLDSTNGDDFGIANAAVLWHSSANPIVFATNNTQRMRIDGSGNVGIGTASPGAKLQVQSGTSPTQPTWASSDVVIAGNSAGNAAYYQSFSDTAGGLVFSTPTTRARSFLLWNETNGNSTWQNGSSGALVLNTNGAERMRVGGDGNVGIGTSSPSNKLHVFANPTGGDGAIQVQSQYGSGYFGTYANYPAMMYNSGGLKPIMFYDTNNSLVRFYANETEWVRISGTGETITGGTTDNGAYNLQCNGTGVWGAGAYVNGSDARLKDDITTLNDGLNVVSQLRPVTFKYKPDYSKDQNVQTGFIAQELQAVLAGKDYVDGIVQTGPNHLNVAYQSLIPILTKAIQEQQAMIDELKAKVAALEAK